MLRLCLPLVGGFGVAVVVDAVLPPATATAPAVLTTNAPAVAVVVADSADSADSNNGDDVVVNAAGSAAVVVDPVRNTVTDDVVVDPGTPARAPRSTRDAALEARIDKMLVDGKTPYAAVVVMEAHTGRILAIAEHSTRTASEGLALRPMAPAASIFKIVTSSALLEQGVSPSEKVCFHGGKTRMSEAQLKDDKRRDHVCVSFDDVVPLSANVAVAKLANKHLTPALLRAQASKWGFGHDVSVLRAEVPSTAVIPDGTFGFAQTAAGFGDVKISALQGAVIAGVVANDGVLVPASDVVGADVTPRRVVSTSTARALRRMMTATVTEGTGKAFRMAPRLPVSAAGKTGSLTDYTTGLDSSWFVGFAPAEAPELVVAAVVVNTAVWHIKAPWLAKESLRLALRDHGPAKSGPRVAAR